MLFEETSYKNILRQNLEDKKARFGNTYTFQKMASACGVQKTYLSRVLANEKSHLNSDQLFLASEFLGFSDSENEFLFLLFEYERSVVQKRRSELKSQIDILRRKNLKTETSLSIPKIDLKPSELDELFLNPYLQLIQVYLTIDRFAEEPEKIAEALLIPIETFHLNLKRLETMGLVRREKKRVSVVQANLHLSSESPLIAAYRSQMRLAALEQMRRLPPDRVYSFSAVFSTTPEIRSKIHAEFLKYIKQVQKLAETGAKRDVFQMNFDLLPWS